MTVAYAPANSFGFRSETRALDKSILRRIAAGDQAAVSECLDEYGGLVWSLAKRFTSNADDADDATQEIFVELWQSASRFDPSVASECTFISAIARRRLIDRLRRNGRRPETVEMSLDNSEIAVLPVDTAELADEAAKAARCMQKLPVDRQQVLSMSIQHGLSHATIAQRLHLPLGTVKSYARRALLQIRACMHRTSATVAGGASS